MALLGAHMLLYSSEPEALRAMLRDVFDDITTTIANLRGKGVVMRPSGAD